MAEEVVIYSTGLVHCSVCVPHDMTAARIEEEVNQRNPTGISSPWKISEESTFKSGASNPTPCERANGEARLHYLMEC